MPGKLLWISLSLILFLSCQKEHFVPSRGLADWDYLPLSNGDQFIYNYTQITFLGRGISPDTVMYKLKEEVVSEEHKPDGTILFTMLTSRENIPGEWQPIFYWNIRNEFDRSIFIIDNIEIIELQLPLVELYTWESLPGGEINCRDTDGYCDLFQVEDVDKDFVVQNILFNHTTKVIKQRNLDPLQISRDIIDYTVFAQGIGLVYSEKIDLEYSSCRNGQNPECCCDGNVLCTLCAGEIEFGTIERKLLVERVSQ